MNPYYSSPLLLGVHFISSYFGGILVLKTTWHCSKFNPNPICSRQIGTNLWDNFSVANIFAHVHDASKLMLC